MACGFSSCPDIPHKTLSKVIFFYGLIVVSAEKLYVLSCSCGLMSLPLWREADWLNVTTGIGPIRMQRELVEQVWNLWVIWACASAPILSCRKRRQRTGKCSGLKKEDCSMCQVQASSKQTKGPHKFWFLNNEHLFEHIVTGFRQHIYSFHLLQPVKCTKVVVFFISFSSNITWLP